MRQSRHRVLTEDTQRWTTLFELVSASLILLLMALVILLIFMYRT